ncbi:MAG: hypothetical protein P1U34_00435 [Coxiellaceae bacterium]|nr:hypothetical protein [Coxiellaceae bacterium]
MRKLITVMLFFLSFVAISNVYAEVEGQFEVFSFSSRPCDVLLVNGLNGGSIRLCQALPFQTARGFYNDATNTKHEPVNTTLYMSKGPAIATYTIIPISEKVFAITDVHFKNPAESHAPYKVTGVAKGKLYFMGITRIES